MLLYHTGYREIPQPDVHYGRKNADFGRGFYTTPDRDFALRWARERRDTKTVLNIYELELAGLRVHRFARDGAWFDYLFANRAGRPDALPEAAVIVGPIANDTIYDTLGIITSGFLSREQALALLMLGPEYRQIVLKTERAAGQLHWRSARVLFPEEIARCREMVAAEEAAYQTALAETLENMP